MNSRLIAIIIALLFIINNTSAVDVVGFNLKGFNMTLLDNNNQFTPFVEIGALSNFYITTVLFVNSTNAIVLGSGYEEPTAALFIDLKEQQVTQNIVFNTSNEYMWSTAYIDPTSQDQAYFYVMTLFGGQIVKKSFSSEVADMVLVTFPTIIAEYPSMAKIVYMEDTIYSFVQYPGNQLIDSNNNQESGLSCSVSGCTYLYAYNYNGQSVQNPIHLKDNFYAYVYSLELVGYSGQNAQQLIVASFYQKSLSVVSVNLSNGALNSIASIPGTAYATTSTFSTDNNMAYIVSKVNNQQRYQLSIFDLTSNKIISNTVLDSNPGFIESFTN